MIIDLSDRAGKYGYYTVDKEVYFSKWQAWIDSKKSDQTLRYHFNDDIFCKYDWTREPEPSVSLKEFYRRRAEQLRSNADYLVLLYSGGPDSTNVLRCFVDNAIHLDEIVNMNSYARTGIVDNTIHNADYLYNVEPYLKHLLTDGNFKSKVTILDEIELVQKHWRYHAKRGTWQLLFGAIPAPSMILTKTVWIRYVPHLWKQVLDGKRIVIICAADKTPVTVIDGRYATYFADLIGSDTNAYLDADDDLRQASTTEWFYHSPDCADLIIKQCHVLKKTVDSVKDANTLISPKEIKHLTALNQRPAHTCESKKFPGHHLDYTSYHETIYPGYRRTFVTPKTSQLIMRPEDNWWIKDFEYHDQKVFLHGLIKLYSTPEIGIVKGASSPLPILKSRPYFLE